MTDNRTSWRPLMRRLTPPHLVLFDLDGTLADSIEDIAGAVNAALAEEGLPLHSTDDYKAMVGDGFRVLIRRVLPPSVAENSEAFERIRQKAFANYLHNPLRMTKPYPGARDTLHELRNRGIRLAVLTNKPHELAHTIVANLFPDIDFLTVQGDTGKSPRKPDPHQALAICTLADVPPSACWFVGDSAIDMQTAHAAGMPGIGAAYGYRNREELLAARADAIIDTLPDLLLIMDRYSV
ncbi:MAG: HAD family hydrolase [Spirochaetaceae bacterium]|nr:HAD family hydrolase [Spirochaetaceae bacterium]